MGTVNKMWRQSRKGKKEEKCYSIGSIVVPQEEEEEVEEEE